MKTPLFVLIIVLLAPAVQAQSLYSDYRARGPGDVITIVLAERTSASRASEWDNRASNSVGGTGSVSNGSDLSGRFALDASFDKDAASKNSSLQRDLLTGTMTAIIQERDAAGNLVLSGTRSLNVNGETHRMEISGLVRPMDIRTNNTVLSYQIANASIVYDRAGGIKRSLFKPGRLVRFGAIAILGGAAAFAMK